MHTSNLPAVTLTMHPFHIFLSVFNLCCATLLMSDKTYIVEFAFIGEIIGNSLAVITLFLLLPLLSMRFYNRAHHQFLKQHSLGLFNGVFIILFWIYIFNTGTPFLQD